MNDADATIHVTLIFDEDVIGDLAAQLRRFDPTMTVAVDPHVTVVYPDEYTDLELLMARARTVAANTSPFTLSATGFVTDSDEDPNGAFVALRDPTGSWDELRRQLLAPPFRPIEARPHLTIADPRTSKLGPTAWSELRSEPVCYHLVAHELALSATSAPNQRETLERLAFTGTTRAVCVGVLPVADGRVLLGHRHPDRRWYPDTWDAIGGHVEPGESLLGAACREAAEELAITVAPEDLMHVDTISAPDVELALFATRSWQGIPTNNAPEEHASIRWFEPTELEDLALVDPALLDPTISALANPS